MSSNIVEEIANKAAMLPPEQQREALNYIETLASQTRAQQMPVQSPETNPDDGSPARQHRSLKGSLAHLNQHVTEEEIREARREMWRGYMREDSE